MTNVALPFLVSSLACLECLNLPCVPSFTFVPRQNNYISPLSLPEEIKTRINNHSAFPIVLDDISLLSTFHTPSEIASTISSLTATSIVVVCCDKDLFVSLQPLFKQAITETPEAYLVYSTRTKKAHAISKVKKESIKQTIIITEDRDVMSEKQKNTRDTLELPFEKMMRFGDDSDVSSVFSGDDDLDV